MLSEHPYLYCEHEPVNRLDPSGHDFLDWIKEKWKGIKEWVRAWFDWGGSDLVGEIGEGAGGLASKLLEGVSAYFTIKEQEERIRKIRDRFRKQDLYLDGDKDEQDALKKIFPGRYR